MSREGAAAARVTLEAPQSPDALIAFLTISHPNLGAPIRVVSDVIAYELDGETYAAAPFDMAQLDEGEGVARSQLQVQNVDRRIGEALRRAKDRAEVRLEMRSSADFDLTVEPRVELVANPPVYGFRDLRLVHAEANAAMLTGEVTLHDYALEPWPSLRATQGRCPALYT